MNSAKSVPQQARAQRTRHRPAALAFLLVVSAVIAGCASTRAPVASSVVQLPLQQGWFDGEEVFYVTTDVSDAEVAAGKRANHVPRLADALRPEPRQPGQRSAVDKVYAVTNFEQGSVFASAPGPVGALNRDTAYSPLWQMVTVTWIAGRTPRPLKSQEQVLAAADKGDVNLSLTTVVLNCPIVQRGARDALPGVSIVTR